MVEFPASTISTEPVSVDILAAGRSGSFSHGLILSLSSKNNALLETQRRFSEAVKEIMYLLEHQFSLANIKNETAAILFCMGFSSYEALMSLYHYIEPKLF